RTDGESEARRPWKPKADRSDPRRRRSPRRRRATRARAAAGRVAVRPDTRAAAAKKGPGRAASHRPATDNGRCGVRPAPPGWRPRSDINRPVSARPDLFRRWYKAAYTHYPLLGMFALFALLALSGPIYDFFARRRVSRLEIAAGVPVLAGRPIARLIASSDAMQTIALRWL